MAPRRSRGAARRETDGATVVLPTEVTAEPTLDGAIEAPAAVPEVRGRSISYESILYLIFIAAAILSRFWELGAKALHHDESLHAYYSWVYETGGGYRHDPLMHGPFLFHANALVYLLFGDSDASSRYMPAFFGVVLVALPYLLRSPHLFGRWGALCTSFFFLISPVLLYQSRYIRHDIYTVVGTLVLFIAIVRYWEVPQRRWIPIGLGSLSFLITNHEIVFALAAIFAGYLYGAFILSLIRDWRDERQTLAIELVALHGGALVLIALVGAFSPQAWKDRFLDIPWENPTKAQQQAYYKDLIQNPLILSLLAIMIAFVVLLWLILNSARNRERADEGFLTELLGDPEPRTIQAWVKNVFSDHRGLWIGFAIAAFIFVTLFTSLYTNLYGLVSSTFATDGTLLYWLGQHDVRRGEQPWFYFLVLMPQYEFLAVIFGCAMAVVTTIRAIGSAFGLCAPGKNLFVRFFVVVWFAGIFAGLSFAGEKMPWLTAHITLPATMLAAIMVGAVIDKVNELRAAAPAEARSGLRIGWPEWALGIGIAGLAACWFLLAGRWSLGKYVEADGLTSDRGGWIREMTSYAVDRWWWLAIPPLVVLLAIAAMAFIRGTTRAGLATALSLVAILTMFQVSAGFRLSYQNPDIPTEMMIYTQTSPDVTRVVDEFTQLSFELTGGYGMEVWYDSGVSWPMQWYFRDFPNKRFVGDSIAGPPSDVPIVLVSDQYDAGFSSKLTGYTAQEYVLRWWFPEEEYRDFAIAPEIPLGRSAWDDPSEPHGPLAIARSIIDSVNGNLNPTGLSNIYRLIIYRDLERKLGQYNFKLYVRNDLIPMLNGIRY